MNLNYQAKPMMGFVEAIKACFAKYANFKGRARRSEFWWFYLLNAIVSWCASGLVKWKMSKANELMSQVSLSADFKALEDQASSVDTTFYIGIAVIGIIMLVMLLPLLSAHVRRLHDIGKSGHLMWLYLLCGIGGLVPLLMCVQEGKSEANAYGESPKYVPNAPKMP